MISTSRISVTQPPQTKPSPRRRAANENNVSMIFDVPGSCSVDAGRHGFERRLRGFDELRRCERAWLTVDRLDLGGLDARDPVLLETPCLGKYLSFERADGLVVGLHRAPERPAELREV